MSMQCNAIHIVAVTSLTHSPIASMSLKTNDSTQHSPIAVLFTNTC